MRLSDFDLICLELRAEIVIVNPDDHSAANQPDSRIKSTYCNILQPAAIGRFSAHIIFSSSPREQRLSRG